MCTVGAFADYFSTNLKEEMENSISLAVSKEVKIHFKKVNDEKLNIFGLADNLVFSFILENFPRNFWLISHSMVINTQYRGLGIAQYLQGIKERICKLGGFDGLVCTVNSKNTSQIHILEKAGWTKLGDLDSNIQLWKKEIIRND